MGESMKLPRYRALTFAVRVLVCAIVVGAMVAAKTVEASEVPLARHDAVAWAATVGHDGAGFGAGQPAAHEGYAAAAGCLPLAILTASWPATVAAQANRRQAPERPRLLAHLAPPPWHPPRPRLAT